jgi:eukaryotic-like serine/threonine-protein kinase
MPPWGPRRASRRAIRIDEALGCGGRAGEVAAHVRRAGASRGFRVESSVTTNGPHPDRTPDRSSDATIPMHPRAQQVTPAATGAVQASSGGGRGSVPAIEKTFASDTLASPTASTRAVQFEMPTLEGYDVVRRVGQGGMGAVYEGVQLATGRRVAIKFLLNADLASDALRERFEREVAIVARLDHPGIIRVIDSGVKRGRYYYVMDFVEGTPLDETFARLRGDTRRGLRLIIDVCEAVDYAHQRGVLHRDLKPSNIIVDREGRPRLLDFGIAKSADADGGRDKGLTYASEGGTSMLGTLAYMSPEQAAGESHRASVRTDVYSLGVIAFECVTGRLPVSVDGSLREALTRIIEQDPPRPSSIIKGIAADLDAVLLKALDKAPERRYASASELADDLTRYLDGEPVTARRIGSFTRLLKWTKRHKAISATIAIATGTLLVVSGVLVTQVLRERDEAQRAAAESKLSAQRAIDAFADAQEQKNQALASAQEASENFDILRTILRSANSEAGGEVTVRQMLDRAIANIDKAPPKNPRTEAAIRETMGFVYRNLGVYDQAKTLLKRAYEVRVEQASDQLGDEAVDDLALAACAHEYAATLWWRGEYADAQPLYQQALQIRRKIYKGDHKDVAFSLTHLAANNLRLGKVEDAFAGYTEALEMRRRLYGAEHEEVAQSLNNLAKAYFEEEQFDRAEENFRDALAMIRKLRGDQYGGTAAVLQNFAQCLLEKGDVPGAVEMYSQALDVRTKLFPSGHHLVASTLVGLARAQLAAGDLALADDFASRAIAMYRKLSHEGKSDFGEALAAQGAVRLAQKQYQSAIDVLTGAAAMLSAGRPIPEIPLAHVELDLGEAMFRVGNTEDARAQLARGLDRVTRIRGTESKLARASRARIEGVEKP